MQNLSMPKKKLHVCVVCVSRLAAGPFTATRIRTVNPSEEDQWTAEASSCSNPPELLLLSHVVLMLAISCPLNNSHTPEGTSLIRANIFFFSKDRESVKPLCRRLLSSVDKWQVGVKRSANQSQSGDQRQLVRVNF